MKSALKENVYLKKFKQVISEAVFSDDDDRKLMATWGDLAWNAYSEERQKELLKKKLGTKCKDDLLTWLKKPVGEPPKSYTVHAPEQRIEILFRAVEAEKDGEQGLDIAKKKTSEVLGLLNESLKLCDDFDFIDTLEPDLKVKNLIQYLGSYLSKHQQVSWQLLVVAAKFKKLPAFLKHAENPDEGKRVTVGPHKG